jgi:hypothetical protein
MDVKSVLAKDKEASSALDLKELVNEIDSEDKLLDRILLITKNTSGIWFNPIMLFSKSEINQARYFQLECRKVVNESGPDYEINASRLKQMKLVNTVGHCKIKLLDQVALSKISLKPNMVGGVDQWTTEFIITSAVAKAFKNEQLSGLNLKPVYDPKTGKHYAEYFQLYTSKILPPVVRDATMLGLEELIPEEGGLRELGCLTYDFSESFPIFDFNRTSENFGSNYMPLWVVSASTRNCFLRNRLRGWSFRPVFEKGSELYNVYITKWMSLLNRMTINPLNRF